MPDYEDDFVEFTEDDRELFERIRKQDLTWDDWDIKPDTDMNTNQQYQQQQYTP